MSLPARFRTGHDGHVLQLRRRTSGFTLTELAVVFTVVALLIGSGLATFSARIEIRNSEQTVSRLNAAAEAIVAFAMVNGRLPCPARYVAAGNHSGGQESFCNAATGTCAGAETTAVQAHGNCSNFYDGYVPAAAVAAGPADGDGFAVDAWGNRLRYAVARDSVGCAVAPPAGTRVWTSTANMKTYGVACRPADLDVCANAACTSRTLNPQTIAFVVFSTGKNGAVVSAYGADEAANTDGNAVFVSRIPSDATSPAGSFDDLMVVQPVAGVYARLVASGVMP